MLPGYNHISDGCCSNASCYLIYLLIPHKAYQQVLCQNRVPFCDLPCCRQFPQLSETIFPVHDCAAPLCLNYGHLLAMHKICPPQAGRFFRNTGKIETMATVLGNGRLTRNSEEAREKRALGNYFQGMTHRKNMEVTGLSSGKLSRSFD